MMAAATLVGVYSVLPPANLALAGGAAAILLLSMIVWLLADSETLFPTPKRVNGADIGES